MQQLNRVTVGSVVVNEGMEVWEKFLSSQIRNQNIEARNKFKI